MKSGEHAVWDAHMAILQRDALEIVFELAASRIRRISQALRALEIGVARANEQLRRLGRVL